MKGWIDGEEGWGWVNGEWNRWMEEWVDESDGGVKPGPVQSSPVLYLL